MDKKKLGTKEIRKYWKDVFIRAFEPVWGELAMRALIILFFLVLAVLILSGILTLLGNASVPFLEDRIEDFKAVLSTSFWTFLVMVILIILGMYRAAAEFHYDQEKVIQQKTEEIAHMQQDKIGRVVKANIRFEEYPQNRANEPHLSLKVFNDEKTDLTQCYTTLLDLILFYTSDKPINIREEVNPNNLNLTWGGGSPSEYVTIPRNGDHKVLNICKLTGAGLVFLFRGHEKLYPIHGKFMARVAVNGFLGDKPIEPKTIEFCFEHGLPYNISEDRQKEPEVGVRQNIVIQVSSTKEMFTFLDCPKMVERV